MTELRGSQSADIVTKSAQERYEYFKNLYVGHRIFAEALDKLKMSMRYRGSTGLVMVYGPPGAGKSTLLQIITNQLLDQADKESKNLKGRIPVAGIQLDSPDDGNFNWHDHYYVPALEALYDIGIDQKIDYDIETFRDPETGELILKRNPRKADYRTAVVNALRRRNPFGFLVDDAQHFTKVARGARLLDQIDSIKAVADRSKILHVLFGTYSMVKLVNLSPELARRTVPIELRRYGSTNNEGKHKQDWENFQDTLGAFQAHMPLKRPPDLLASADYFYEQSLGCVGILKDLLTRALAYALDDDAETLLPKHWELFALPQWELQKMLQQMIEGETELREMKRTAKPAKSAITPPKNTLKPKNPPGQRKPSRDLVGGSQDVD
jgi:hypothetical protein